MDQYANEEQALLRRRYRIAQDQIDELFDVMRTEVLSSEGHVAQLASELAELHGDPGFRSLDTMGRVLHRHLSRRLELHVPA